MDRLAFIDQTPVKSLVNKLMSRHGGGIFVTCDDARRDTFSTSNKKWIC